MTYASCYGPEQSGPEFEQWIGSPGFTVTYQDIDPETLALVRDYQSRIRAETPDWTSRLEFDPTRKRIRIHVYPQGSVVSSLFRRPLPYAFGK